MYIEFLEFMRYLEILVDTELYFSPHMENMNAKVPLTLRKFYNLNA